MNEGDIQRIESELGVSLPQSYKAVQLSYPFGPSSFGSLCMLVDNADAIIDMNKGPGLHELMHGEAGAPRDGTYLMIGNDGGEEEYFLDISQADGPVMVFDLESGELSEFARDIKHYVDRVHEIDAEIDTQEREAEERRRNAKWWEFWKKL